MKKLLVLLLLVYPLSASAVTYEWTDDGGTVSFTEDLGNVPKKYRKKVKVLGADDSGTPQIIESAEPVKPKPKETGAQKEGTQKEKKTTSAREEAALRNDYFNAQANLQAAEQEIADLRARMEDTSTMSRTEYLSIQNSLKQDEFRVKDLKKKVDQAREKAEKAGVDVEQNVDKK